MRVLRVPLKLKFYYLLSLFVQNKKTPGFDEDFPRNIRSGEEFALENLKAYLQKNDIDTTDFELKQFPSGYSNLTYFLKNSSQEMVLRRPPYGAKSLKGGHDMLREYTVLKNLKSQFNKVPKVYHYCDDKSILGAPFYIMDRVQGYIIRPNLQQKNSPGKEVIEKISNSLVDTLVELHSVNIKQANLNDLGKINGYVKRQVEGWTKRYFHSKTDSIRDMEFVAKWLNENQPKESKEAIIHNDFKYDNLVLDKNNFSNIISVLDWEMATIGDPFMDLGTTLGYWIDSNDLPELKLFQLSATTLEGNPSREGILEMYEKKSGYTVNKPVFYYVFGLFKIAVIAQQIYFRYKKGFTKDKRFGLLNLAVMSLSVMAKQAIAKDRLSNLFE
ncbi:MAG: phosphotransferase family protein [Candidatus Neomarinimicrobiota bacterium]